MQQPTTPQALAVPKDISTSGLVHLAEVSASPAAQATHSSSAKQDGLAIAPSSSAISPTTPPHQLSTVQRLALGSSSGKSSTTQGRTPGHTHASYDAYVRSFHDPLFSSAAAGNDRRGLQRQQLPMANTKSPVLGSFNSNSSVNNNTTTTNSSATPYRNYERKPASSASGGIPTNADLSMTTMSLPQQLPMLPPASTPWTSHYVHGSGIEPCCPLLN